VFPCRVRCSHGVRKEGGREGGREGGTEEWVSVEIKEASLLRDVVAM